MNIKKLFGRFRAWQIDMMSNDLIGARLRSMPKNPRPVKPPPPQGDMEVTFGEPDKKYEDLIDRFGRQGAVEYLAENENPFYIPILDQVKILNDINPDGKEFCIQEQFLHVAHPLCAYHGFRIKVIPNIKNHVGNYLHPKSYMKGGE